MSRLDIFPNEAREDDYQQLIDDVRCQVTVSRIENSDSSDIDETPKIEEFQIEAKIYNANPPSKLSSAGGDRTAKTQTYAITKFIDSVIGDIWEDDRGRRYNVNSIELIVDGVCRVELERIT